MTLSASLKPKDGAFVEKEPWCRRSLPRWKVSRGYDRVVGQLLRYMTWVEQNMETSQPVRGVIVANEITADLKLACSRIPEVRLIEYEIAFKLRPI
jgi:endonuclease